MAIFNFLNCKVTFKEERKVISWYSLGFIYLFSSAQVVFLFSGSSFDV